MISGEQPIGECLDLSNIEQYCQHQVEVIDWLDSLNDPDVVADQSLLMRFCERYGLDLPTRQGIIDDIDSNLPAAVQQQMAHIDAVVVSFSLSPFQKAGLLAISARAFNNGRSSTNGQRLVAEGISFWREMSKEWADETQSRKYIDLYQHMTDLQNQTEALIGNGQSLTPSERVTKIKNRLGGKRNEKFIGDVLVAKSSK